jgi:hypothetical protein
LDSELNKDYRYIISDVRYLNEAAYIRSCGGILVKIIDSENSISSSSEDIDEIDVSHTFDNERKENLRYQVFDFLLNYRSGKYSTD